MVADLKARIDCQRLAEQLLGEGKRSGRAILYSNPGVQQRTPSFAVYPDGYKDHKTGERGDAFSLIRLATGCDFAAALDYAASFVGLSTDAPALRIVKPAQATQQPRQTTVLWRTSAEQEVERCSTYLRGNMPDAQAALTYLRVIRGLTDDTIRAAHIGYNPDFRKTAILNEDGNPAYLLPGITIPWYDPNGQIVAVRVRCRVGNLAEALGVEPDTNRSGETLPKYVSLSGSILSGASYGLIQPDYPVVLVEGEFDALIGQQNAPEGVCIVTLGSASGSLSPALRDVLIAAPRVVLALDTDDAGQKAVSRLAEVLHKANLYTSTVPLGKDLTDYITAHAGLTSDLLTSAQRLPLPDTWRAALNKYAAAPVAPTVELFIEAQRTGLFDEADGVTVTDLVTFGQQLGRHVAAHTVRRGLETEFFTTVQVYSLDREEAALNTCTVVNNPPGGRPAQRYSLVKPAEVYRTLLQNANSRIIEAHFKGSLVAPIRTELLQALAVPETEGSTSELVTRYALALDTEEQRKTLELARLEAQTVRRQLACLASAPFPVGWRYANAADYRAVFARALAEQHDGAQACRVELAAQWGISPRAVDRVRQAAGLSAEPVFVECVATCSADLEPHYSRAQKGYVKVAVVDGQRVSLFDGDGQRRAQVALNAGETVTLRVQQANAIHVATDVQPPRAERLVRVRGSEDTGRIAVAAHVAEKRRGPNAPKAVPFFGTGHDPVWAERQINNILNAVTAWRRNGAEIVNMKTNVRLAYSVSQVLALLLEKSEPCAMDRADQLCGLRALAERESQNGGNAPGIGRTTFMAKLTEAERDAVQRFDRGEEW